MGCWIKKPVIREEHTNHCPGGGKKRELQSVVQTRGTQNGRLCIVPLKSWQKKFAWIRSAATAVNKPKQSSATGFLNGLFWLPGCATIGEAFDLMKQRGYRSEFDREDWSIPAGFRG
ncbi:replication protein RepL [Escherichia coli]|nr:replication protein RepL [Escherichia coli]